MRAELRAPSESLPRVMLWAQCVKMGATWPWALMQTWWVNCLMCRMKTKVKSPNLCQKPLIPLFTGMWYIWNLEALMGMLTTLIGGYCKCRWVVSWMLLNAQPENSGFERKESLKRGLMESAPDPNGLLWIQESLVCKGSVCVPEGLKQNGDFSQSGMRTFGTTSKMRKPGALVFF